MITIGLIGAGRMGETHSEAYRNVPGVRLGAVCDLDSAKAGRIADGWGASVYSTVADMLKGEQLDAVDVCLPAAMHRSAVEAAAARKLAVFCEKPIAPALEDAEAMVEACERAGVVLMIGHVVRFFPQYAAAREQLRAGRIGVPGVVRTVRSGTVPGWAGHDKDFRQSGGPQLDLAIHDFDFLRWCFGPVKRVFSRSLAHPVDGKDHTLTLLRFQNGVMAHVEASWAYPDGSPFQTSFEMAGSEGILEFDQAKVRTIVQYGGSAQAAGAMESPEGIRPFVRELSHFADCVREARQPLTSGREAIEALRISLAAMESARTGMPVTFGEGKRT